MEDWKNDRIGSAEKGQNPMVMVKMKSGFAVIGDNQFLPGYCVLLGYPKASSLNELSIKERSQYLTDMTLIGDAIIKACNPLRVNYSILMNLDTIYMPILKLVMIGNLMKINVDHHIFIPKKKGILLNMNIQRRNMEI